MLAAEGTVADRRFEMTDFLVLLGETATPTPAPSGAAPNTSLALIFIIAAIVVIILALAFALIYHWRVLDVVRSAVGKGQPLSVQPGGAAVTEAPEPEIVGPKVAAVSETLVYTVESLGDGETIDWSADKAAAPSGNGRAFVTSFDQPGEFPIYAKFTLPDGVLVRKEARVSVGGKPAAAGIVIPFVLNNWGRLVIVLFGVGIVAALMVTRILSAEAGIGILGTLLGVGAASTVAGGAGSSSGGSGTATDDGSGASGGPKMS